MDSTLYAWECGTRFIDDYPEDAYFVGGQPDASAFVVESAPTWLLVSSGGAREAEEAAYT